jgi:hypothetical protein
MPYDPFRASPEPKPREEIFAWAFVKDVRTFSARGCRTHAEAAQRWRVWYAEIMDDVLCWLRSDLLARIADLNGDVHAVDAAVEEAARMNAGTASKSVCAQGVSPTATRRPRRLSRPNEVSSLLRNVACLRSRSTGF